MTLLNSKYTIASHSVGDYGNIGTASSDNQTMSRLTDRQTDSQSNELNYEEVDVR